MLSKYQGNLYPRMSSNKFDYIMYRDIDLVQEIQEGRTFETSLPEAPQMEQLNETPKGPNHKICNIDFRIDHGLFREFNYDTKKVQVYVTSCEQLTM